jgi:hypothetical protein
MTTLDNTLSNVSIGDGIRRETWEEAARRWNRQYGEARDNLREAERDIKDLTIRAQKAESERDALKELSIQLAKELVSKCADPVHKHQVTQLQEVDDYFKYRPKTMCTSDSANC